LSRNQGLAVRVEGDGERRGEPLAELGALGLRAAAGGPDERDLVTDKPIPQRRKFSFECEAIVEMQMVLGVEGAQEVRFVQRRKQRGLPSQSDRGLGDHGQKFWDQQAAERPADFDFARELRERAGGLGAGGLAGVVSEAPHAGAGRWHQSQLMVAQGLVQIEQEIELMDHVDRIASLSQLELAGSSKSWALARWGSRWSRAKNGFIVRYYAPRGERDPQIM
jgi:hypothetical protein